MARIVIIVEDKGEGTVSITLNPSGAELKKIRTSGRSTMAHKFAEEMVNAVLASTGKLQMMINGKPVEDNKSSIWTP